MKSKIPQFDDRCILYSAEIETFSDIVQKIIPSQDKALKSRGCNPMFLVVRGNEVKAVIEGCNSPQLDIEVAKYLPAKSNSSGTPADS
jgi:hypothetical protein